MTKEDIIRMAREADIEFDLIDEDEGQIWYITSKGLERFAALVAAAEREACAKVCDERVGYWQRDDNRRDEDESCAAAIRARGQE
jgi:hypothetical protein